MMCVTVNLHRPEPAEFDVYDSGRATLRVGALNPELTLFFADPTACRDWLIAALTEVDVKLGLVRAEP